MKVFRAFYGSALVQLLLNSILYWILFADQARDKGRIEGEGEGYKSVVLIFVPSILMSINYALLYL